MTINVKNQGVLRFNEQAETPRFITMIELNFGLLHGCGTQWYLLIGFVTTFFINTIGQQLYTVQEQLRVTTKLIYCG